MDERAAYTWIGHRGMSICNPISSDALDVTIDALPLSAGGRCLDLGCGKGELLVRLARRHGIHGKGYDLSAGLLSEARERAGELPIEFVEEDLCRAPLDGTWDLAAALGASHALGGTRPALQALSEAVRPGGLAVIGEGYWRSGASAEAKAAIGDGLLTLGELVEAGALVDLVPWHVETASEQDWDRYEWGHQRNLEEHARESLDDEMAARLVTRGRAWRQLYVRLGRDALGFALVAFRKHPPTSDDSQAT